jgi:hypothetical protein
MVRTVAATVPRRARTEEWTMTIVGAGSRLSLDTRSWYVRAGFEFEERDGTGSAALVEGATLLLFHTDAHIEAIALADVEGLEVAAERPGSIAVHHAGRRLVLHGEVRDVLALQHAAGSRQRRAPAGAWLWAEPDVA